ncbi:hypothetical protein GQ600_21055 [Phytophthora cactorum]|nr:hypothetical protein GQ600_21055 [Phytophthora cactorum]
MKLYCASVPRPTKQSTMWTKSDACRDSWDWALEPAGVAPRESVARGVYVIGRVSLVGLGVAFVMHRELRVATDTEAPFGRRVGLSAGAEDAGGDVIVALSGAIGVPSSGSSRPRVLHTTKSRHMMMTIPTPPSRQMTVVLVEESPSRVPVILSDTLFEDEDCDDALVLVSASLPRKLLCGDVVSCSIGVLDSDATCAVDGAAVGVEVVGGSVLTGAEGAVVTITASVAAGGGGVDTGVLVVGASVATGVVAASVATGGVVTASVATGVAVVTTGAAGSVATGVVVSTGAAVASGFAAVTVPTSCA